MRWLLTSSSNNTLGTSIVTCITLSRVSIFPSNHLLCLKMSFLRKHSFLRYPSSPIGCRHRIISTIQLTTLGHSSSNNKSHSPCQFCNPCPERTAIILVLNSSTRTSLKTSREPKSSSKGNSNPRFTQICKSKYTYKITEFIQRLRCCLKLSQLLRFTLEGMLAKTQLRLL